MLYFKQPETDRLLWFKTDSSVRGGLGWNELCNIEIPVPDLQVQKDIIRQYNQISDAIKIKEKLNNNLEQQAFTIFDNEFPKNARYINLWYIPVWSSDSSFIDEDITPNVYFWYILLKKGKRKYMIFKLDTRHSAPEINVKK